MQDKSKKRWLIRDKDGRVTGPLFTDEVIKRIALGEFTGDEMISLYPSADWIPISNDPEFYDTLLEYLEKDRVGEPYSPPDKVNLSSEDRPEDFIESRKSVNSNQENEETKSALKNDKEADSGVVNRAERVSSASAEVESDGDTQREKTEKRKNNSKARSRPRDKNSEKYSVLELKKRSKVLKNAKSKKIIGPLCLVLAVMATAYLLFVNDNSKQDSRIHLIGPHKGMPPLSAEAIKDKSQRAVADFIKDTASKYIEAEHNLVQVVEGDSRNAAATALLCLDYLELWPYSHQDSSDLYTIGSVTQIASQTDPAGIEANTCRVVDLLVRGRFIEARSVTDMVLNTFGGNGQPPIAFYYFKAKLFLVAQELSSAISYVQSTEQLWPQWLRLYSLEAEALQKLNDFNEAANKYQYILKINPDHKIAKIELGVIEYKYLNNFQSGKEMLESVMHSHESAPSEELSQGYLGLAEIYLREQNNSKALTYAQLAYSNNSGDLRSKEIILQIGGEKRLLETKVLDVQLVYEGDQLVREGDCNAAQAHYIAAYDLNHKNALAAMKAAECLWQLSLSTEAIDWLNKAIRSDVKLIDAYVLLADYFSQRFNYIAAADILAKAKSQDPKSYKVYKGYALVESRRNNAAGAVTYAERAIQLYEADVESYVILTEAYINKNDPSKALDTASKAIEIDMNDRGAQIAYANALASAKGLHVGIDYLLRLVTTYPTISEFRLALGELYLRDQRYKAGQDVFEQVIRIEEKPKKAYIELGKTLELEKQYENALAAFLKAAALDPSDVQGLFLAGLLYLDVNKPNEARMEFQRVLRINKDYPLVNYYIGKAAMQMDSYTEALEQAKIEKDKNPNLADPYLLAAEARAALKQYSQCAGEYQQAIKLRPAGSDMFVKMARCYRMSGNLDAAVSMINQAAYQESGNPEVWKEQGAIYEVRQEPVKAIEAYNQYLVLAPNAPDRGQVQMRIRALSH